MVFRKCDVVVSGIRSEEHTSELQSRRDLVCRLLLDPSPPPLDTLSLHDALPISCGHRPVRLPRQRPHWRSSAWTLATWLTGESVTRAVVAAVPCHRCREAGNGIPEM